MPIRPRYPGQRVLLLCVLLGLAGCSNLAVSPAPATERVYPTGPTVLADSALTRERLYLQHRHWAGTPYRLGGLSRTGIDCSGLVQTTFAAQFGIDLPRTSAAQQTLGEAVRRDQLRPGDLLFFRTGADTRHVGIYIEADRFLHASTRRGVTLSSLENRYWDQRFWQARRL